MIGTPRFEFLKQEPAQFSPDGTQSVVVTRKGNLANNTNEYSLLLFRTAEVFSSSHSTVIATLASSSDDPAIDGVRWIGNSLIAFLGEKLGTLQQIYTYDLKTEQLTQVSLHGTDVIRFDATAGLSTVVFLAKAPIQPLFSDETLKRGLVVSDEEIGDLLIGRSSDKEVGIIYPSEFFVQRHGAAPQKVDFKDDNPRYEFPFSLSPDGRYTLVCTFIRRVPGHWKQYEAVAKPGAFVFRYVVVDTLTGTLEPLLDAPLSWEAVYSQVMWAADSKSVVISNTYLPFSVHDASNGGSSANDTFVAEVEIATHNVRQIAKGNAQLSEVDGDHNTIWLRPMTPGGAPVAYHRSGNDWQKVNANEASGRSIRISDVEDMNTPPRLSVSDRAGTQRVLLDLNPQLAGLTIGHVEEISWSGSDGNRARGGLYLPADYSTKQRYPLIIQTHGWDSTKFRVDGDSTAGYAAQALASKGFVVVQASDDIGTDETTTREGPRETAMYEGLIDYLDSRGLIDRRRVGLLGWSRTGYRVRYALTFSKYPVAAAVIADGLDASYFQYLIDVHGPEALQAYEHMQGAAPFGDGLQAWLKNATGFNLGRVMTPVRLLGFGPRELLYNWEWYAGLRHLGKPVELVWLRDASHSPVKPWERLTAQQGTVDWFCFWMKNEEDSDPNKAGQYVRWRGLKRQSQGVGN